MGWKKGTLINDVQKVCKRVKFTLLIYTKKQNNVNNVCVILTSKDSKQNVGGSRVHFSSNVENIFHKSSLVIIYHTSYFYPC